MNFQAVMNIAGLRGGVAYGLSIESRMTFNTNNILTLTYLITILSILIVGFFLETLVDKLNITKQISEDYNSISDNEN